MNNILRNLKIALNQRNGYEVAACITPEAPKNDPGRLYAFHRALSEYSLNSDLRYALRCDNDLALNDDEEVAAWIEVFAAYWKAIGELLAVQELENQGRGAAARWDRVYDAWKDVLNVLIRRFTDSTFPAWQISSLYVGGKYLRVFAMKADEQASTTNGDVVLDEGFQDDFVAAQKKGVYLSDAARQVNRIFTCCAGDR